MDVRRPASLRPIETNWGPAIAGMYKRMKLMDKTKERWVSLPCPPSYNLIIGEWLCVLHELARIVKQSADD